MNLAWVEWQQLCTQKKSLQKLNASAQRALEYAWQHRHKQFDSWCSIVERLPSGEGGKIDLKQSAPLLDKTLSVDEQRALYTGLRALMPWRKGPFSLCGLDLDCEWRSDWKYERLRASGVSIAGKHILDVGCGNGYFMLRLLGDDAGLVVGMDPSWHYFAQYLALKKFYQVDKMSYLPLTLDDVSMNSMDLTLSMGVLYHRRDPLQHLWQLRETLRPGGEVIIETLVVEGDKQTVFLPPNRYAGMANVWFLPSIAALCAWLERLGFTIIYCSSAIITSNAEQRRTEWMDTYSLADFMYPDFTTTIEGHIAPRRVLLRCFKK